MVDSTTVLWGQTLAYTFYVLAIMAVMGWFALRVTPQGPTAVVKPGLFYSEKLAIFHFWAHLLGGIGMGASMGMAGLRGMLRRSLYVNGEFNVYMVLAALSGSLLLFGFLAFFYNIVMSLGLKGVVGFFTPSKLDTTDPVPAN